jgi:hypothetical protein
VLLPNWKAVGVPRTKQRKQMVLIVCRIVPSVQLPAVLEIEKLLLGKLQTVVIVVVVDTTT